MAHLILGKALVEMNKEHKAYYQSEIGLLEIVGTSQVIHSINFIETEEKGENLVETDIPPAMAACLTQLDEYFKGERQTFSLNLDPEGTEFQKAVWRQVTTIPYGQTASYLDMARLIGDEKAVRAVGAANGQNRIVIIIPCHRVVGSNGKLIGYGGGLWRKAWLLNHERRYSSEQMALF
jgi:methylated-DNA-[protein]-cysteine S-methyltransferase